MKDILDYLKDVGLEDIEAKLYMNSLKMGPMTVRELAESIEIKRTTAYAHIDHLIEKGLLMKLVQGSKKLVGATDPKNLEPFVEQRLESAKKAQQELPIILKSLTNIIPEGNSATNAEIKFYKGVNGVQKIYEEALQSDEILSYVNLSDIENVFPSNVVSFDKAFQKNQKLHIFEIIEDSPASRKQIQLLSQNNRYSYRFLPKDVTITASDILIFDGKVAIVNVRKNITGVIFFNIDYYNISKELFLFMWRTLQKS